MMNTAACLDEAALWPAATGETLAPTTAAHLQCCARCTGEVERLRSQRALLRSAFATDDRPPWAPAASPTAANSAGAEAEGYRPTYEPVSGRTSAGPPRSAPPSPARIGRYPILRPLKLGGQAMVYLARHPALEIDVVVKWAHAPLARRPHAAARFAVEARVLAELRHPHLAQIYDLGIECGRPFLVMEHIAGQELSRFGQRPLRPLDAARLIARIARALAAVHARGVLHLDIQPDNILVGPDQEPKLIDFGSILLRTGVRKPPDDGQPPCGTPEYMAPEQLAAEAGRLDARTDVYSLGAVLHELLTGIAPQPELVWGPATQRTTRLSAVPATLQHICRKALHPDPARRFASAQDLASALERFVTSRSRWWRGVLAAAILLLNVAFICFSAHRTRPTAADARPPAESAESAGRVPLRLEARINHSPSGNVLCAGIRGAPPDNAAFFVVMADGRMLPFTPLVQRGNAAAATSGTSAEPTLLHLRGIAGTTMVVLCDLNNCSAHSEAELVHGRRLSPLPRLPPGTVVHLNNQTIELVLPESVCRLSSGQSSQIDAELVRLQAAIAALCPTFRAVLAAAGDPGRVR